MKFEFLGSSPKTFGSSLTVRSAKLPGAYAAARDALAKCERVDECKNWADKAAALASYGKQAKDERLEIMARRIRLRAIERGGELLKQIKPARGANQNINGCASDKVLTRKDAAKDAGLSEDQALTMLRVANVPDEEREALIESAEPPTVEALAERGTKKKVQPAPHREEWADWTIAVRHLCKLPDCGLAALAQRSPTLRLRLVEEARAAKQHLEDWLSVLETTDA